MYIYNTNILLIYIYYIYYITYSHFQLAVSPNINLKETTSYFAGRFELL